jgi:polysaccharide pyruvyl transferase CsaB
MKVIITGYYGAGNGGDELILTALVQLLKRIDSSVEVVVLSFTPEETTRLHEVSSLYRAPMVLRGSHRLGVLRTPWWKIYCAVREADLVIVGGGGLLEDIHNYGSIPQYLQTACMGILAGRPVIGVGLGVGPMMTELSRRLVRLIGNHMALISVRDQESADELIRLGIDSTRVQVGADLVFSLAGLGVRTQIPRVGGPRIGVTIGPSDWLKVNIRELAEAIELAAQNMAAQEVVLFPMGYDKPDEEIVQALAAYLSVPHQVDTTRWKPKEFLDFIAGFDVIVSAKLHGIIAAACTGVPTVCISYAPKVSSVAKRLGRIAQAVDQIDARSLAFTIEQTWQNRQHQQQCDEHVVELASIAELSCRAAVEQGIKARPEQRTWHVLRDALIFILLTPISISRQAVRSYQGNLRWATGRKLPRLHVTGPDEAPAN